MGCMWGAAIVILAVVLAAMAFGAPIINEGGLSWDNSLAQARFQAKVEVERQREITRRIESQNWHDTAGKIAVAAGVVGAMFAVGWAVSSSVAAWAARPHRAQPQQVHLRITYEQARRLAQPHLQALPGSRLEWVEGDGWSVVDDQLQIVKPLCLTDSQYSG